jgi:Zn-finger nucleic acid-binding protein
VRCEYCRARLATVSCPSCFALLFDGAAFCHHCGAERSRAELLDAQRIACPACKGSMAWVRVGESDLLECDECDGTWIEADAFERLCTDRERQATVLHSRTTEAAPPSAPQTPLRYRPCPRCGKLMNRINFARMSGTVVDVCKGHGTFLDRGELHQIVRFIQQGGMDRARDRERQRIVDEQRRLREMERTQGHLPATSSSDVWTDHSFQALLSALFEHK